MARPKKKIAEKHDSRFPTVRCTQGELASLKSLSAQTGLTLSEYIRRQTLKGKVVIKKERINFPIVQELNKIGVNLNQLTRKANMKGDFPAGLQKVFSDLENIFDIILGDNIAKP